MYTNNFFLRITCNKAKSLSGFYSQRLKLPKSSKYSYNNLIKNAFEIIIKMFNMYKCVIIIK